MENAVIYARYSSHAQSEQSIEGQLAAAYKYAKDRRYQIVKEYCDRAKTGTNDNREEFQKMLKDTAKHKFTVIIVWKVDRFGRNREEITINKYKCKKNGVRVEYVAENISQGPEGVILESVLEGMAEYYSLQLSQNVSRGYLESAKKYHVIGQLPLGYDKAPDKTYMVNENEAKIVKMIFDKYNSGESQADIVRYLNSHGYTNKKGKAFTKSTIQRLLNDERYIGTYTFKDLIKEENIIEPILDREVFYANRSPKSVWSYEDYPLSKYLYCKCGGKIKGSSGNGKMGVKYKYYICPKCKKTHVRCERLEKAVDTRLKEVLENHIDAIADGVYGYYLEHRTDTSEEDRLRNIMSSIDDKMANLVRSIENGVNPDIIVPRIKELESQRDNVSLELSQIAIQRPFEITLDAVKFFLHNVDRSHFINKIVLTNTEAAIAVNCVDTEATVNCSTITREMGKMGRESNFLIVETIALVKTFF